MNRALLSRHCEKLLEKKTVVASQPMNAARQILNYPLTFHRYFFSWVILDMAVWVNQGQHPMKNPTSAEDDPTAQLSAQLTELETMLGQQLSADNPGIEASLGSLMNNERPALETLIADSASVINDDSQNDIEIKISLLKMAMGQGSDQNQTPPVQAGTGALATVFDDGVAFQANAKPGDSIMNKLQDLIARMENDRSRDISSIALAKSDESEKQPPTLSFFREVGDLNGSDKNQSNSSEKITIAKSLIQTGISQGDTAKSQQESDQPPPEHNANNIRKRAKWVGLTTEPSKEGVPVSGPGHLPKSWKNIFLPTKNSHLQMTDNIRHLNPGRGGCP